MEFNRNHLRATSISREAGLLIACGAACATDQALDRVADFTVSEIDWNLFRHVAAGHGMSSIAWRVLAAHAKLVPTGVLADLRTRHLTVAARALYLAHELLTVIDLLDTSGVPAIVFKGPTLAALAYDQPGLREFSDLDILVQPAARARVRQTLIAHCYRPKCSDGRVIESPIFQCTEEAFVASDGVTVLDLHWRILPHYTSFPDADSLWARAGQSELRGHPVATLATEDLLLFLCVHGAKHGWPLLSWICDLAGLIFRCAARGVPIDWRVLVSRAEAIDSRRPLLLGLRLAHDLMNAAIPPDLIAACSADPVLTGLSQRVIRAMFRNLGDRAGLSQELTIPLQSIESPRAKLRYLAGRALTPTLDDWCAMPLPPPLFPLYYLTRPMRLAFAQAGNLLRRSVVPRT
jgi:Uncharacterised nucleotidyltransferase